MWWRRRGPVEVEEARGGLHGLVAAFGVGEGVAADDHGAPVHRRLGERGAGEHEGLVGVLLGERAGGGERVGVGVEGVDAQRGVDLGASVTHHSELMSMSSAR